MKRRKATRAERAIVDRIKSLISWHITTRKLRLALSPDHANDFSRAHYAGQSAAYLWAARELGWTLSRIRGGAR